MQYVFTKEVHNKACVLIKFDCMDEELKFNEFFRCLLEMRKREGSLTQVKGVFTPLLIGFLQKKL